MPYSLIFNILPLSNLSPRFLEGKHLHALFLNVVSSVDQNLAQYLHDSQINKAFTISPLQLTNAQNNNFILQFKHDKPIKLGQACWWRITLLDDSFFGKLTPLWLNLNPEKSWHLGNTDLYITSILGTPHVNQPWANAQSYEDLYQNADENNRIFKFIFATPTAFRQGKYDTALPSAESVFNGLLKRWNKYSEIEFQDLPIDLIYPCYFNINTEIVINNKTKFIGCVGEISFRLFGDVSPTQIKQLNCLANYALYCGLGRKTTMGFGMVKRF